VFNRQGTDNDKTISRSDSAILRIRKEGDILKESTFQYYKEDGSVAEAKGGYFYIVDGGYNIWIELIAPFKHEPKSSIGHVWSKQIESVRKDVECVFGILKKRFMILKHPIRLRRLETIEHVFLACAVLHNLLIDYDGHDDWEEREEMMDFEDVESDIEGDGMERRDQCLRAGRAGNPLDCIGSTRHELHQRAVTQATEDTVLVDIEDDEDDFIPPMVKQAYFNRQQMLMTHFKVASAKNEIKWV
jgi:hypothetical protein